MRAFVIPIIPIMNNVITIKGMERIKKEYDSVVPIWGDQCGARRTRKYNTSPPQRNLLFNVQKLVCSESITLETELVVGVKNDVIAITILRQF